MGSFQPLATTMPALSPVAWSSFITGMTPGGHGIADFIARDPLNYTPVFAIYENRDPDLTISVGDVHLPIKGGGPHEPAPGQAVLVLPHRARHPGLDLQDPDQLPGRRDRHQGYRRHGNPGSRRFLRRLHLLHLRSIRGLPEHGRRRGPLRRRQQERRPLEHPRSGQLAGHTQGHQFAIPTPTTPRSPSTSTSTPRPTAPVSTSRARASCSNAASIRRGSSSHSTCCR